MNQFDNIFGDKLNEEQAFTGQQHSWGQVNRDLQAFELGKGVAAKSLALWKAVGIVAVLSLTALVWDRHRLVQENEQLKTAIQPTEVVPPVKPAAPEEIATVANPESPPPLETVRPVQNTSSIIVSNSIKTHSIGMERSANAPVSEARAVGKANRSLPHPTTSKPDPKPDSADSKNVGSPVAYGLVERVESPVSKDAPVATTPAGTPVSIPAIAQLEAQIDSLHTALKSALAMPDSLKAVAAAKPDSIATQTMPIAPKLIDPVKIRSKRWQAGVRLIAGRSLPKEPGVSMIAGQGVGLAYRVWRNISVTASADFLKFDVNADTIPQHCSDVPLPTPGPGHHFFRLRNVASNRALQRYTVGIRYTQPIYGGLKVSLNAAYAWTHLPSRLVSLRFEEDMPPHGGGGHPEEEYQAIRTPKDWISNVYQLGVGLHYETRRWAFGIKADYALGGENKKPSCNAAFASADFFYRF